MVLIACPKVVPIVAGNWDNMYVLQNIGCLKVNKTDKQWSRGFTAQNLWLTEQFSGEILMENPFRRRKNLPVLYCKSVNLSLPDVHTALATLQQVNRRLIGDVAFWLWATVRPLKLMRHLKTVLHFRYMRGAVPTRQVKHWVARTAAPVTGPRQQLPSLQTH